jgi:hypothetical protein
MFFVVIHIEPILAKKIEGQTKKLKSNKQVKAENATLSHVETRQD